MRMCSWPRAGGTHLVKVEDKVQFAYISKVLVEHLNEQVDGLQAPELVVVHVHAQRKE
jgi:hypothetical protein